MSSREFTPDDRQEGIADVPYFDEARAKDGWQGQASSKSLETLKAEIIKEIAELGGRVTRFSRGIFHINGHDRSGYEIEYNVDAPDGNVALGRFDIAALPVKKPTRGQATTREKALRSRHDKSLRMALYNVVESLRATRVLTKLSPGYHPLISMMLADGEHTLGELWIEGIGLKRLQPPDDVIEGDFEEV